MAEIVSLEEAVAELVSDGDAVALEGFTHLIPHAAGHEMIRQGRRGLTLIRLTPDIVYDQMIGMGCAAKLVFSWGGNPGVGSLHRLRDAVEHGWPEPLRARGALATPAWPRLTLPARPTCRSAVLRGYAGTDLPAAHHGDAGSTAPSPASGWRRCGRCGPTSASSTPSGPTARATSSCGGSAACRRRRCWRRAGRW